MKLRLFLPPAIVVAGGIVFVAAFTNLDNNDGNGLAGETPVGEDLRATRKSASTFSPYVDAEGNISLPTGYKRKWTHLGNWAVAKQPGNTIHEMHDVYTQPETIDAFNETGEFPDGAVLVKEVRETKADQLTTGHSAWSTDMKLWFVMIKDRKERFGNSDHWGDGWGWALFEAKDPSKNVSAGYDTSCLGCHVPAEDSDWVYTYGYPDLKKPK